MALTEQVLNQPTFPEMYERLLVNPLFRPWAEALVARAAIGAGDEVLDVACGTGIVARLASERVGAEGRVVGVDVGAPMLAVARKVAPAIDWREGRAEALPLRDAERFSVVTCQQGLQFFPDRPAAAREMRRALGDGGRLAVSVWRTDEEAPVVRALREIAELRLGPIADARHAFSDAAALATLLRDAGFEDVQVQTQLRTIRFADGAVFARLNAMALLGMSAPGKSMGDEERAATVASMVKESEAALARHTDSQGLAFEIAANVATGRG